MKKLLKKSLAIVLTMLFFCNSFSASAIVVGGKNHFEYGSYVLLGDSVASGWSDIEDRDTCFTRVEGSYGAVLADDLGLTDSYHPMACIGFRTLEMRYMFEDDYEGDSDKEAPYSENAREDEQHYPHKFEGIAELV